MDYKVTWSVDIFDVNSPEEAALQAWKKYFQNSPDRIANVFTVQIDKESGAERSVDLQEHFDLEKERADEFTAFGFNAQDVIEHAEQNDYTIDEKQANAILHRMLQKGDVSIGISWDTVLYFIEEFAEKNDIKQTGDED